MEVGDLIQWQDKIWLVRKIDEAVATSFLEDSEGNRAVLDQDGDNTGLCQVLCNPVRDWPSAPLPFTRRTRLIDVYRGRGRLLKLQDWMKLDEFQIGGSLLLNPALALGFGDRLVAVYAFFGSDRITSYPITIPRNFASLNTKTQAQHLQQVSAPPVPVVPPNMFDLITGEDDEL